MTARAEIWEGLRERPVRRPMPDRAIEIEVPIPEKPRSMSNPFAGLFRTKQTEKRMGELTETMARLDQSLARENYLGVKAVHFQMAVDAMLRIGRPDLKAEFEQARDDAIRQLRSTPPLRKRSTKG